MFYPYPSTWIISGCAVSEIQGLLDWREGVAWMFANLEAQARSSKVVRQRQARSDYDSGWVDGGGNED